MRFSPPDLTAIDVPDQWLALVERLPSRGRIIVIGPTDSGKTTFAWWLAEELSAEGGVVLVDADVGQSRIGPPACVGWLQYGADRGEFEFVGHVSPAPRPASALAATVRMALRGQRLARPRWIVVDTTGYVDGPGALRLKTAKIQLLAPATVIAVGHGARLDHLRWPWRGRSDVRWLKLEPAEACVQKTWEQRARWRQELFAQWLADGREWEFELDHLALHHVPQASAIDKMRAEGRLDGTLVGLDDENGIGLCLGLLRDMDLAASRVWVWAPEQARDARGLRLGAIRLRPDGSPILEGEAEWQSNTSPS